MEFSVTALTMCAASDEKLLDLWVSHYGTCLGSREHLYVIIDGRDSGLQQCAEGVSFIQFPIRPEESAFEKQRWWVLQHFSEILSTRYDAVICGDVDELVTTTPDLGVSLPEFISQQPREIGHISPLGFELIQMPEEVVPLGPSKKLLEQRRYGRLNSKYAKPCILLDPFVRKLKPGGHIWHNGAWNIRPELMLFHLKAVDETISYEVAESRGKRVAALEANGATKNEHGIRGWQQGAGQISEMQAWMTERISDLKPLASLDIPALTNRYERRRKKIKRCPSIQTGPFQLGTEWQSVI